MSWKTEVSKALYTLYDDAILTTVLNTTTLPPTTEGPPKYIQSLKQANKVILTGIMAFIMLAMGCLVTSEDFKKVMRRPVGVAIGFCSQFFVLPLTTFGLAHALQLKPAFALGLMVTGTCPGGVTSNLYTFWTNGDVCLSITMTTLSTVVAMGMMPLNLFIYSRSWTDKSAVIPYTNIVIALALILVPVALGILIKHKKPSWCKIITTLGSIFGLLGIAVNIVLNGVINPSMLTSPWQVWLATFLLPFLGYIFGYFVAWLFRRPHKECRTICFETGAQNIGLALALLLITFQDSELLKDIFVIPSLAGPFVILNGLMLVGVYLLWKKYHTKHSFTLSKGNPSTEPPSDGLVEVDICGEKMPLEDEQDFKGNTNETSL